MSLSDEIIIPVDPRLVQIFLKLGWATILTLFVMLCRKVVHVVHDRLDEGLHDSLSPRRGVPINLTRAQRSLIKEATGRELTVYMVPDQDQATSLSERGNVVAIRLTPTQRTLIREATGRDSEILDVPITEETPRLPRVSSVSGIVRALTGRRHDLAMSVLNFADNWAATAISVTWLILKMRDNIQKWTS